VRIGSGDRAGFQRGLTDVVINDFAAGVLSLLGAGGGLAGILVTIRHFRTQRSIDRRTDAETGTSLADGLVELSRTMATFNETLTKGVFEQNTAHSQAMATLQASHAADMAREREHCDGRLSAMGRRLDEAHETVRHVERNARANLLAMARLVKVAPERVEAAAAEELRLMEADGDAVAGAR
jgi:hypothetical protein